MRKRGALAGIRMENLTARTPMQQIGSRCKRGRTKISMRLRIFLPRHRNARALKRPLRRQYSAFLSYAKLHENVHKSIFIRCARTLEKRLSALRGGRNCEVFRRRHKQIFDREVNRCSQRHAQYDRKEASRISRIKLLVSARRGRGYRTGPGDRVLPQFTFLSLPDGWVVRPFDVRLD